MDHNKKNLILSIISIACLVVAIAILFSGIDIVKAADTDTNNNIIDKSEAIILVGDSRVMQMSYMNSKYKKNFLLVFSNGGGINSIDPKGGSRYIGDLFKKALKKYTKAPVVFSLGVNCNSNPSSNAKRTKIYDYYIKKYPDRIFIISSVGGTGKTTTTYKNSNVKSFNKKLKEKYVDNIDKIKLKTGNNNIYYYDLYTYLKDAELIDPGKSYKGTRDGLHYTNKVYRRWLKDLRSFVEYIKNIKDSDNKEYLY